ncbi:MAG: alpha-amylase family protein [Gammaproteobacteria bacterium]|nr:alpha-amylase family protein [Gammaproteobacteria bacterium]MBU1479555.1 alpha-amylase family protein [Gammaproteobacteria bacterium]MBU2003621.1 alpha-amylase family protein [Gammaproteobacteria bacterium]MBU2132050.1 alpha-amylase family protein [Gammaproteobacteria bacterium]MBU2188569.1 alpha-amylase family protein [Gammaproteobacteria bacterium]
MSFLSPIDSRVTQSPQAAKFYIAALLSKAAKAPQRRQSRHSSLSLCLQSLFNASLSSAALLTALLFSFSANASALALDNELQPKSDSEVMTLKPVVYQIFTRLYGNKNPTNKPWGTIADNGVGKFNDIDDVSLNSIKDLGVTHVWYTGVPHHALIGDYSAIGVSADDPDVVKGRAGSPYAVKDYYNVNPDLAVNPANRLAEFEALIQRSHQHGLKVMIDIVPNHVARHYQSVSKPQGVRDFGEDDDTSLEYAKNNNFYYVVDKVDVNKGSEGAKGKAHAFEVPSLPAGLKPLGGEAHPLSDGKFNEFPAKWTGNGSRLAKPDANDWYETVKINYGVRPDGTYDFPRLPANFATLTQAQHYAFWQQHLAELPSSWIKFNQIAQYWLAKGVDGFRYDMAEMVPVEFWSYLNNQIKHTNPDAFILAEVYNPKLYRNYIQLGKMDYLYDKVDLYDTLKAVMAGKTSTANIAADQAKVHDIESHMLHFLENHDEQRIGNEAFLASLQTNISANDSATAQAVNPNYALPAMVVSATIGTSPTLVYFGQEVGEAAIDNPGFGHASRTSIFDYVGVPAHQRWMNNGKFDGGQSTQQETSLRAYYQKLLTLSTGRTTPALLGQYYSLDAANRSKNDATESNSTQNMNTQKSAVHETGYDDSTFAFARFEAISGTSKQTQKLIIVSNFSQTKSKALQLKLPKELIRKWQLKDGVFPLMDLLEDHAAKLVIKEAEGLVQMQLAPLSSAIFELED